MGRTVQIELDVQDAKAVAAWQRSRDSISQFHQQLDGVDKSNKKNQASAAGFFGEVKRGIGSTASAITGVTSALGGTLALVAQIRAEYDNIIQRQRNAADTQLALAPLESQLFKNVGSSPALDAIVGLTDDMSLADRKREQAASIITIRDMIAKRTGQKSSTVTEAFSNALSARGDGTVFDAADAVVAGLRAFRDDPAAAELAGSAALDLRQAGASQDQALGFVEAAGSALRITKSPELFANLPKTVVGLKQFGANERTAASLFSLLTRGGIDTEGRSSSTAAIGLAQQLEKAVPEADTLSTRRDFLLDPANEARRQKFVSDLTGEKRFIPTYRALFDPRSDQSTDFARLQTTLPTFAESGRIFRANVAAIESLPNVQLAEADRRFGSIADQFRAKSGEAQAAVARQRLKEIAVAAGDSALAQRFGSAEFELSTGVGRSGAFQFATAALAERRKELLHTSPARTVFSGRGSIIAPGDSVTREERQQADIIGEQLDILRDLLETQKQQLELQRRREDAGISKRIEFRMTQGAPAEPAVRAEALVPPR